MKKLMILLCVFMMLAVTACGIQAKEKEMAAKEDPVIESIVTGREKRNDKETVPKSGQSGQDMLKGSNHSTDTAPERTDSGQNPVKESAGTPARSSIADIPQNPSSGAQSSGEAEKQEVQQHVDERTSYSGGIVINDRTDKPIILPEEEKVEEVPAEPEPEYGTEAYCAKYGHYIQSQWVGDTEYTAVEKPVYELHNICHACGTWLENMTDEERCSHLGQCRAACSCERVQVGTIPVTYALSYAHDVCGHCGKDFGRNGKTGE